ncbi:UvrB/UvrC motif-containing protein [Texcoconibacillus texcoconensis]|uniref:Protein arginine kinase activator n=1 Tax=Texcoconibacillus texcoconensis TaxID=1095777 RepID=A0A840QTY6_9BACI|nr:UvrB/UvrC motif-containing protein [Texcoconibacillus texcoconensis]MBB5175016.1 protein arginine kinase activator [Texcoconibacillus texcoconensis]
MLCQECQQRQATLHFTKIINGEKTEFHICDVCAKEKGEYIPGSNSFSIHQLLSGLLDFEQPKHYSETESKQRARESQCESCGMTYRQFAESGRFGCVKCYETFKKNLDPIFKRLHSGNTTHAGKIPKRKGKDLHIHRQIDELKQVLKEKIDQEEFEEAAELRDQIRSLQQSLDEKKEG